MRILFVAHCFPPPGAPLDKVGGMQRVGLDLLSALRRRTDVEVSTHELATAGWWHYVSFTGFLVSTIARVRRAVRRREVDAVLFSAMPSGAAAVGIAAAARAAGVPLASISHGHDVTMSFPPYQWLVPKVFDSLDAVLPVSRATGEACLARGLDPAKLHVLPNGIEPDRFLPDGVLPDFEPGPRHARLAAAFPALARRLPEDALVMCAVGRQVRRKGHAWFVEHVMPRLSDHVHFVLGGTGPEAAAIAEAALRAGVAARVHPLGKLTEAELAQLYLGSDLFVMPNIPVPGDMEGFGVVMLEAGLAGLPVIAARLEGISDVVSEGVSGHLVEPRDADGFVRRIEAYDLDRAALARLARSGHAHVRDTFSWPAIAGRYVALLRRLTGGS